MNYSKSIGGAGAGIRKTIQSLLMTLALVGLTLPLAACGNKTTLDRIGNVAVAAATAFDAALVQYLAGKSISEATYQKLKPKAEALIAEAKAYDVLIDGYAVIGPNDIGAITFQTAQLVAKFRGTLQDGATWGLSPNSTAIKVLNFAVDSLTVASAIFAGLFPPPAVVTAQAGNGIPVPKKALRATPITLPKRDKETQKALQAAGEKLALERCPTLRNLLAD